MTEYILFKQKFNQMLLLLAVGWIIAAVPLVLGQMVAMRLAPAAPAANKAWTFGVVSIRRNKSGGAQQFGPTPDGYRMRNLFMVMPILTAYIPRAGGLYTGDQTVGFPDWVLNEPYDIDAKVSEADLADWQNPASQPAMLRAMLQAMLADHLKLVVHRGEKELSVYSLVVGKNGPKFKEAEFGDPHTGGITLPGGAVVVPEIQDGQMTSHYFGISMAMLATFLSDMAGRTVQDKTGLTGKYDVTVQKAAPLGAPEGVSATELGPSIFSVVEELGLKLKPAKGQVEALVIDHVEPPSAN